MPRAVAQQADNFKSDAIEAVKQKAVGLRDDFKTDKPAVAREVHRNRDFGREGGEDVKHIVWTGHTVRNQQGQSFYGAAGLTSNGYYRSAEVQVYGQGMEKWNWEPERHTSKQDAIAAAKGKAQSHLGEAAPAVRTSASAPHPVMSEDYFPNVWQGQAVRTPSGTLVGVVNVDKEQGLYYAGVHHFPREISSETSIRWAHQPHGNKEEAVKRAETFVRRGARAIIKGHQERGRMAKEWHEDAKMGRGEVLQFKSPKHVRSR